MERRRGGAGRPGASGRAARKRVIGSALFVVAAGSLLHFAFVWSGRNPIVAIFSATNESTWEHLKLAFWPALLLAPVQRWRYGPLPGFLPGTVVRCLLPSVSIVALFYGYTAVTGANYLAADIATFVVAVCIGEVLGHVVMVRRATAGVRAVAAALLMIAVVAFSTLSFAPPSWFLFRPPHGDGQRAPGAGRQP